MSNCFNINECVLRCTALCSARKMSALLCNVRCCVSIWVTFCCALVCSVALYHSNQVVGSLTNPSLSLPSPLFHSSPSNRQFYCNSPKPNIIIIDCCECIVLHKSDQFFEHILQNIFDGIRFDYFAERERKRESGGHQVNSSQMLSRMGKLRNDTKSMEERMNCLCEKSILYAHIAFIVRSNIFCATRGATTIY